MDGFGTHESLEFLNFCFENNIIRCKLPSHTLHKLQPHDISVFGPLKTAYREQVEQLTRGGASVIGKQHFTSLYSRARDVAFTPQNIKSGWCKAGLYPFSPDKVLKDIQQSQGAAIIPQVANISTELLSHHDMIHTPVTWESLTYLRAKFEQETALNSPCKHRFHKLANAAEKAFADRAILLDENRLLFEQNNEKMTRSLIRLTVTGTAKFMTYEDIMEAQRKRDIKEATTPARKTADRKRQNAGMGGSN
jgi:DDE superfamily endonuclease